MRWAIVLSLALLEAFTAPHKGIPNTCNLNSGSQTTCYDENGGAYIVGHPATEEPVPGERSASK